MFLLALLRAVEAAAALLLLVLPPILALLAILWIERRVALLDRWKER